MDDGLHTSERGGAQKLDSEEEHQREGGAQELDSEELQRAGGAQEQQDSDEKQREGGAHQEQRREGGGGGGEGGVCAFWCCCCYAARRRGIELGSSGVEKTNRSSTGWRMGSDDGDDIGEEDLEGVINADAVPSPEHLVILVNGIVGSANDWKFAAGRLRSRLGRRVAIHCSEASASRQTFDGVDVMGKRLADEVREIIDKTPGVAKISFLAHSLGGLVTRYAISQLYCPPMHNGNFGEGVRDPGINSKITTEAAQSEYTIGGLQAENFITLATPHLGCRGTQQLPFLLGIQALEKTAPYLAHWFVGKSGKHLFLTDGSDTELPLLRKMASDCKEGQFISSLGAFKKRTAYANVANDKMVGWRTASMRRKSELPEVHYDPVDPKYPHIVHEEDPPLVEHPQDNAAQQVEDILEEAMVTGLNQVPWHRVDVSFRGAKSAYLAHNLIQVKNRKSHIEGQDVIEHVIDKQFSNGQDGT